MELTSRIFSNDNLTPNVENYDSKVTPHHFNNIDRSTNSFIRKSKVRCLNWVTDFGTFRNRLLEFSDFFCFSLIKLIRKNNNSTKLILWIMNVFRFIILLTILLNFDKKTTGWFYKKDNPLKSHKFFSKNLAFKIF